MSSTATFEALVKATPTPEAPGAFEALVACFNTVDSQGDRILEGAFDRTIVDWQASGRTVPVIFSHRWDSPLDIVGHVDPMGGLTTTPEGLVVKGQIDNIDSNPTSAQVHNLLKAGTIREWSFGYTVPPGGESRADDGAQNLSRVTLLEVGPCVKGVNSGTRTIAVKADDAPRGGHAADIDAWLDKVGEDRGTLAWACGKSVVTQSGRTRTVYSSAPYQNWGDELCRRAADRLQQLEKSGPAPVVEQSLTVKALGWYTAEALHFPAHIRDEAVRKIVAASPAKARDVAVKAMLDGQALVDAAVAAQLQSEASRTRHVAGAHREHDHPGTVEIVAFSPNARPIYGPMNVARIAEREAEERQIAAARAHDAAQARQKERIDAVVASRRQNVKTPAGWGATGPTKDRGES